MPKINFELHLSKTLISYLVCLHFFTAGILFFVELSFWIRGILLFFVFLSLIQTIYRSAFSKKMIVGVWQIKKNHWILKNRKDHLMGAHLKSVTRLFNFILILHFRSGSKNPHVLIWRDAIPRSQFRRLLMVLKYPLDSVEKLR